MNGLFTQWKLQPSLHSGQGLCHPQTNLYSFIHLPDSPVCHTMATLDLHSQPRSSTRPWEASSLAGPVPGVSLEGGSHYGLNPLRGSE